MIIEVINRRIEQNALLIVEAEFRLLLCQQYVYDMPTGTGVWIVHIVHYLIDDYNNTIIIISYYI